MADHIGVLELGEVVLVVVVGRAVAAGLAVGLGMLIARLPATGFRRC
jgi:hypothetical protein